MKNYTLPLVKHGTTITTLVKTLTLLIVAFTFPMASFAQEDRILSQLDAQKLVRIKDNAPKNLSMYDLGPVEPDFKMGYVTLMLKPTNQQRAALQHLLSKQQDMASPHYHRWLTSEQYASRFGISETDIAIILNWLEADGFKIVSAAKGRDFVTFAGTARQIETIFHTEIHRYKINGEEHIANTVEPSIPEALAGVVSGIHGLNDFRPKPAYTDQNGNHFLGPNDVNNIYNILQLYSGGNYMGQGQNVVIAGASDINIADYDDFFSTFDIQRPTLTIYGAGEAGHNGYENEADIDIEWAGAIARAATIIYVETASASAFDSAVSAIDNGYGQVVSISFGLCEPEMQSNDATYPSFFQMEVQKANSQGMTVVAASGDTGPAACDAPTTPNSSGPIVAVNGLAVAFPASVPEVTAVGGTEFDESMLSGTSFWGPFTGAPSFPASAVGYIPQIGWNDSPVGSGLPIASSGGGASILFAKPSWQTGPGVPNDNARDVPDISVDASLVHDGYLDCPPGDCQGGSPYSGGGTSFGAPIFAGILAITNQFAALPPTNATGGLGNLNIALYVAAISMPPCFASYPNGIPVCAFNDVTLGDNIVACSSTPDCQNGAFGFSATPGYDQVTGVGAIADSSNFAQTFSAVIRNPNFTLTSSSSSLTLTSGASGQLTITVTPTGYFDLPVNLSCSSNLPSGVNCSFAALTVTPTHIAPSGAVNTTLTIQTTAASAKVGHQGFDSRRFYTYALLFPFLASVLLTFCSKKRVPCSRGFAFAGLLMSCAIWTACAGSSSSNGGGNGGGGGGTPSGTSSIIVLGTTGGSNPISQQLTINLTVQ